MKYKYELSNSLKGKVKNFKEFANGGTQATVVLINKNEYRGVLISNGSYIVALRDHDDLPFDIEDIANVFQRPEDEKPANRSGWVFWDDWTQS